LQVAVFFDQFSGNHERQVLAQKRFAAVAIVTINDSIKGNAPIFTVHDFLYLPVKIWMMSVKPSLQIINNNETIFVRFKNEFALTGAKRALKRHYGCPSLICRLQLETREKRIGHLHMPQDVTGSTGNLGHMINFGVDKLSDSGLPFLRVTIVLDLAFVVPND
jgi:hypothetical protein